MNILFFTATYPPSVNGVAISTMRTVDELRRLGHKVWIVGPSHKSITDTSYIPLQTAYNVPGLPEDYPLVLPWMSDSVRQKILDNHWDIVHAHHPAHISSMALQIAQIAKVPAVFTYHSQYFEVLKSNIPNLPDWMYEMVVYVGEENIISKMNAIIANTHWLKRELVKKFRHIPVYYASTGGIEHPYLLNEDSQVLRNDLGIEQDHTVFVIVSRLSYEKNVSFVIRAFSKWKAKNPLSTLLIIGDGNQKKGLMELSKELGLRKAVRFLGTIDNDKISPWLNAADVFLYSSLTDTGTINIIEALSAGLPVVALRHKATEEVVKSGKNGYLTEENYSKFVAKMRMAIHNRAKLSVYAKHTAEKFLITRTVKDLLRIYINSIANAK